MNSPQLIYHHGSSGATRFFNFFDGESRMNALIFKIRFIGVMLLLTLALAGCAVLTFAPKIEPLKEDKQESLVNLSLEDIENKRKTSTFWIALRGGRGIALKHKKTGIEFLADLPSLKKKISFLGNGYIPPLRFKHPQKGDRHYYNFTVTADFARANYLYLTGDGEDALKIIDNILENTKKGDNTAYNWQVSYLRVMILQMMGRYDLAEIETKRTEELELKSMGKNVATRALRAEVRYWAGDLNGAATDAAQVIRAIGDWRFPTTYSTPPIDQVHLALVSSAQVRANIVLGLVLVAKGMYKEALPWLQLGEQTMNNIMFVNRHPLYGLFFPAYQEIFYGRGMSLTALGTLLQILDPTSELANEMFLHAQEYFDAMGFQVGNVLIETFRTRAFVIAGRYEQAVTQAQKGLVLANKTELFNYIWRLEVMRGESLLQLQRRPEAEKALRNAQAVVDLLSGTMVTDEAKVRFGVGKEAITNNLAEIDIEKGDYELLFSDLERGRARAFIDMLANRSVAIGRQAQFVEKIRTLDKMIIRERQRKNALNSSNIPKENREKNLLEQRLALIKELRAYDPDLAETFAVSSVELKRIQGKLSSSEVMVYFLPVKSDKNIRLLLISNDKVILKTLDITGLDISVWLNKFTKARNQRHTKGQIDTLKKIYQLLKIDQWNSPKAVYLVPSGDLYFIPWGALDVNFCFAVLPTGGWLEKSAFQKKDILRATIVGDPVFGGLLPQLSGARAEAIAIANKYGEIPIIGVDATIETLRKNVGDGVDILHFATHALYDPIFPLQSALIMSNGEKAVPLTAEDLYKSPLSAQVVVMSACETGEGQVISGDDILGLTRSFYLGGARAVMSSLWPVDDEPTRLFMEIFHEKANNGDYGAAWLFARNALKVKGFPPSTYGAFILGGSLGVRHSQLSHPN